MATKIDMKKCKYCDYGSDDCEIFADSLVPDDYYLYVRTGEWDAVDDDWVYERVYGINYCPYCGRPITKWAKMQAMRENTSEENKENED